MKRKHLRIECGLVALSFVLLSGLLLTISNRETEVRKQKGIILISQVRELADKPPPPPNQTPTPVVGNQQVTQFPRPPMKMSKKDWDKLIKKSRNYGENPTP